MLPHYLLGFIDIEKKEFIVNPNFFSSNKSFCEIVENGFDIDQSSFQEKIDKTDYCGFFMIDEDGIISDTY